MITQQHWDNFDRLVAHLSALPEEKFDYFMSVPRDGCGCVAAHVRMLWSAPDFAPRTDQELLMNVLGITAAEARSIWAPRLYGRAEGFGETPAACLVLSPSREASIFAGHPVGNKADALRRLAVLTARYVRPCSAFVPDDARFLASVRALAAQPFTAVVD